MRGGETDPLVSSGGEPLGSTGVERARRHLEGGQFWEPEAGTQTRILPHQQWTHPASAQLLPAKVCALLSPACFSWTFTLTSVIRLLHSSQQTHFLTILHFKIIKVFHVFVCIKHTVFAGCNIQHLHGTHLTASVTLEGGEVS